MKISDWPASERPREKLIARGPNALSDAELLAILIGVGQPGRSSIDLGRALLADFGSLHGLLSADPERWQRQPIKGIGPARRVTLQAALELARRHYYEALTRGSALAAPEATSRFLIAQLRDRPYEVFCVLYLDGRHRLIAFEELFRGTLDNAKVHPREVVRQAVLHNAAAVILAHNHPSGALEPSQPDELVTLRVKEALDLVEIRVLDHVIVGEGRCYSFSEHGLL
ncbi:MAG TPA: DNA repair protein RadC [Steroidobacteraceae bacterium]|jgi:DNA repair protein RadC